ncbi:glycoside hydrolase family 97 protein [Shewanella sp. 202IG2-18]|uniref:glycoside hydrolase family 97 protein n=1 Tax=Parashewanella hymeniacidonis TaxID=2807618 RepID=UPI00196071A7|nr:glycoside hydrolase family 97 protein [Parashewanella hymeniacidonis]MBM7072075.1 glycoside hydrolase family 97 protein [Parashewanella hymeniacidonis]
MLKRLLSLCLICSSAAAQTLSVTSPNKQISLTLSDDSGSPEYSVSFDRKPVIESSKLGFIFKAQPELSNVLKIVRLDTSSRNSNWEQPWGEQRVINDHHNELFVELQTQDHRKLNLRFKVFDDGLGFRYEYPQQTNSEKIEIVKELTEFKFADSNDMTGFWIPAKGWNRYEFLYSKTPLQNASHVNTPFTIRSTNGAHISIHEAALVNYPSMTLKQQRLGTFQADLIPWYDGSLAKLQGSFKTPWRTIQLASDAKGLLNSRLILNLNEPNKLGDVSWVNPGKYIGIWWEMHIGKASWGTKSNIPHGATTENTKKYIDFAAEHGFDGVLVEGWNKGWDGSWFLNGDVFSFTESYPDFDLPALTNYAKQKNVKIIGHHETSGSVTNYEKQMNDAFKLYKDHGVEQIKTGYVADGGKVKRTDANGVIRHEWHDGQFMVNHYLESVKTSAKYQIAINTHEPIKDTGLRRTYPSWISREGARGQEFNAWGNPPNPPSHIPMLTYTRMLSGPMDFTPGIFDLSFNGLDEDANRPQTTLAKQLATYVVLYSPIQMAADLPENYLEKKDAFQFIKDVPTDWEKSIAVDGEIGEFVVFARQERKSKKYSGEDWYLGAVTDNKARTIKVDLDFLEPQKKYIAQIYRDGEQANWKTNPYDLVIESKQVDSSSQLTIKLASSGGAAIRFKAI